MTFGEMKKWNDRFLQIIGASQILKNERLTNMKSDLELAYPGLKDDHAKQLNVAITEEMGV